MTTPTEATDAAKPSGSPATPTLLACCDDRPGLVVAWSQLPCTLGLTILDPDEGPIIEQHIACVSHRDKPADLSTKGRDVERTLFSRAVAWHFDDSVRVYDDKPIVFD